ncbi:glycosyltransferase [Lysobacter olei]
MSPGSGGQTRYQEISSSTEIVANPVVSVLMLAYNHAAYIEQAIVGVLRQETTFPYELVIAEDCSADSSREIARRFQREAPDRVRVIVSDHNVGMHANHDRAVSAARGEFIAYCEGDDYWVDDRKLQKQVEFMRANPACGMLHGNYLNLIEVGGIWRARLAFRTSGRLEFREGRIYSALLQANRIQTCTALMRRDLVLRYRQLGPGVDTYRVGDWPQFLFVAHESEIGFINQPLAAYRRTPGSVTNAGRGAAVERCLDAIRMVQDFCDYFGDDEATRMCALSSQFRTLLQLAFQAGDRQRFDQAWVWLASNDQPALRYVGVRAMQRLITRPRLTRLLVDSFFWLESMLHRVTFRKFSAADGRKWGGGGWE